VALEKFEFQNSNSEMSLCELRVFSKRFLTVNLEEAVSIVHSERMLLALITGIAQPWPGAKGMEQAVLVSLTFLLCYL
jgi:hypothetical protein